MITAQEALERLKAGNREFAAGAARDPLITHAERAALAKGQAPFAVILGCSDSRVPSELIFNQGFGDLFVIRVAGNIVAPSLVGSVEYAAELFGTRLVVVLGHTQCGAIAATVDELQRPSGSLSRNLRSIVERVAPSVEPLLQTELRNDLDSLKRQAVRANVSVSVAHLRHGSEVLEDLTEKRGLRVVGAEYSLETGLVEWFDGVG